VPPPGPGSVFRGKIPGLEVIDMRRTEMDSSSGTPDHHVAAVQRLFLKHVSVVRGFIVGLVFDLDAADDVLQEAFLTVTAKAATFVPGTDFLAWVHQIARLKALEYWRKRRRSERPFAPEVFEALAAAAFFKSEEAAEHAERRSALRECLKKLGAKARRILELRYTDRMSPREIARTVSWKRSAVDVALSKARRFLRECAGARVRLGES